MSDEAVTKPTLETVLERINDLRDVVDAFRAEMNTFRTSAEERLEDIGVWLDKVQSIALEARSDIREFNREFRDLRSQFKQPA